ncbi:sensor histidine kinase [Sulfurovum sp.]|uniref:sensor histidine kinase n=1 Tax=Sulfurovum sp. TaxID=1969726 RepID=UPI00356883AD
MLKSEKKSLIRFLLIYLGSTFLLFSISAWIFYNFQKHHLLDEQREALKYQALEIKQELRTLHQTYKPILHYPIHPSVDSAIYDLEKQYIYGTVSETKLLDKKEYMANENKLYNLSQVHPYYLGAAFLLVSKELNEVPIVELQKHIALFLLAAVIFFSLLGFFLGKLFVAPMRDSMESMNHFIQDTTHELNTPISTILTNIEMLETFGKCEKNEGLERIEIASKTLSRIYDDLTYLNLNHNYYRHLETLDMSKLTKERIIYFSVMAESKGLKLEVNIDPDIVLEIDKNDATRLVDNLISNAIKYNKPKGILKLTLTKESLSVIDTGIGIPKKSLDTITCRFKRANKSEGGFGIGLDIVNQVVNNYGFALEVHSKLGEGTEVVVKWEK